MITLDVTSNVQLEYLAEGAANVVYRIVHSRPSPSISADTDFDHYEYPTTELAPLQVDPVVEGKLVRLRKSSASKCSVLGSFKFYEKNIVPLFSRAEDRIEQTLFQPTAAFLLEANRQLKALESQQKRPQNRRGTYVVEDEEYGLLITDMTCSSSSSVSFRLFEFKPKWLVQSPTAPADATMCRTCALRCLRKVRRAKGSILEDRFDFCPLGLVSDDRLVVQRTVSRIFGWDREEAEIPPDHLKIQKRLGDFIYGNPLLEKLCDLQSRLDPKGVIESDFSDEFLTAMTLRDCTMFIKMPFTDGRNIEARLGDFDLKQPNNGKGEYWRNLEKQMIEQGYYSARAKNEGDSNNFCLLRRNQ